MNRIQRILDKADREGVIRRVRTDGAAPAAAARAEPNIEPIPAGIVGRVAHEVPAATAVPEMPNVPMTRTVRGARVHPLLAAAASGNGTAAEQYRALRTRIVQADHRASNVLLVTSPGRGEGKSLTAANLALTMAQEYQRRSCIIDADLRSPELNRLFGITPSPGLSDVLLGAAQLEEALVTLEEFQLTILPAGGVSAHPAELLGTMAMRRTLDTLRSQFDRIVIDTPSAAPLADVGILTPLVDGVILVVRAGVTSTPAIHDAVAAIDASRLLGIILNEAAS